MDYEGKIYRPWPEANSLLIQTTIGCTHNKCTFCDMFREKQFRVKPLEQVFSDIEEARKHYRQVGEIFLIDGNVMALKTEKLLKILNKVTETFPESQRISLYAGYNDLRRKSVEELKQLVAAGLSMAYVGLESGDPVTLEKVKKDMTPEEMAPMALAIQPGTELEQEMARGEFIMPAQRQVLEEEKYLLENLNDFDTFYWGDHGNNIVSLKGRLPQARPLFLKKVEEAMRVHPEKREDVLQTFAW